MLTAQRPTVMTAEEFHAFAQDHQHMTAMWRFVHSGFKVEALRTNTLLFKDDWDWLDARVVAVSGTILAAVADLQAAGLSVPNGGLGTMISQYQKSSAMRAATITMDPRVDAERDRRDYPLVSVPVPIIMVPFDINIRELMSARQHGHALDSSHIDDATRSVSEGIEALVFNGSTLVVQGTTIYGYRTHPDRNTGSGASWATASNIYPNVLTMLSGIKQDGYTGPFKLYLNPIQYQQALALNANTSTNIMDTIQSIPGFGRGSVREAGTMPAGEAIMVNMSNNCVDLSVGQDTTVVQWQEKGGMAEEYIVMACLTPRVKSTADGKSGIFHMTGLT